MITLILPWMPATLGKNSRAHWTVRAKLTKRFRFIAAHQTRLYFENNEGAQIPAPPWELIVQVLFPNKRKRDLDNICCKAYIDGMMDSLRRKTGDKTMDDRLIVKIEQQFLGIDPCGKGLISIILQKHQ